ncbi:hypothetical protein niasHS_011661 [Heterodera schachtii]|uniref:ShKT domain-containing protein n=1 Tax=Heterodera schachtii TaxID=97005 RepID=A0ABD2IQL0_HETSC
MDPKPITDPGSVERTAECADRSANCGALKKNGFCWEIRYVRLIRIQCQHTCGFCENEHGNGAAKKQGKDGIGNQNQGQNIGNDNNGQDGKIVIGLDNTGGQDGNEEYDMKNGGQEWEHGIDVPNGEDQTVNGNRGQELGMFGLDKTEGQAEESHGKMGGQDLDYRNGIDEEWHNNNNNIVDGNDGGTRHGNDGIGITNSQNGNANGQINGQEEQKQAESNLMDKNKKKKKKLLLLKTSDEADLNNPKLLNKVDEHYTKWTFPKRRKSIRNEDESDRSAGEEDKA